MEIFWPLKVWQRSRTGCTANCVKTMLPQRQITPWQDMMSVRIFKNIRFKQLTDLSNIQIHGHNISLKRHFASCTESVERQRCHASLPHQICSQVTYLIHAWASLPTSVGHYCISLWETKWTTTEWICLLLCFLSFIFKSLLNFTYLHINIQLIWKKW